MSDKNISLVGASTASKMLTPSAIAIVNIANRPLLIRTSMDEIDKEEATKLTYLMHASLDIVEEKTEPHTARDNFLGVLYQCEQYRIYGLMSATKVKFLLVLSLRMNSGLLPRENDIRQMLKNIQRAYIDATAMNPFYKLNEVIKSKRLDKFLDTIFALPPQIPGGQSPIPSGVVGSSASGGGGPPMAVNTTTVQTV